MNKPVICARKENGEGRRRAEQKSLRLVDSNLSADRNRSCTADENGNDGGSQ
jgi:hypothetical protein